MKKALTGMNPQQTWNFYVDSSVEMFLSNFRHEVPEMDIEKMVTIYTSEIPGLFEGMVFTVKDLQEIKGKLLTYLRDYIDKKGGIENLDLYTEEELEEITQRDVEIIIEGLAKRYNVTTDVIRAELRKGFNHKHWR